MVSDLYVVRQAVLVLMLYIVLLWLYLEERSRALANVNSRRLANVNVPMTELEPYDSSEDENLNEH